MADSACIGSSTTTPRPSPADEAHRGAEFGLATWSWDIASKTFVWSDDVFPVYGIDPADYPAPSFGQFLDLLHPDDRATVMATISATLAERRSGHEQRFRTLRPDGSVHLILSRARLDLDQRGEPLRLRGLDIDLGPVESPTRRSLGPATLDQSEELFRAIAEMLPALVYVHTSDSRNIFVNRSYCDFAGRPPEGLLDTRWSEILHPDDHYKASLAWRKAVAKGTPFSTEYRFRRHDGQWRPHIVRSVPRKSPDGVVRQWIGIAIDITAAKETEARLRDSERRLQLALEAGRTGVYDWNLLTGHVVREGHILEIFGLGETDTNPTSFITRLHPLDRNRVMAAVDEALKEKRRFHCEYRVVHPDGAVRWVSDTALPFFAGDGTPERLLGTITDITDSKEAQERLRENRAVLDAIVQNSRDIVFAKDVEGRYLFANAQLASFFGRSPREVVGGTDADLVDAETAARLRANDHAVMTSRQPSAFEEVVQDRVFLATKSPWLTPDGALAGVIGISHDITDRKRHEEHIQLLLNEMNHRTKNVLSVVQAVVQQTAARGDPATLVERLGERLQSLSASHNILVRNAWQGADLKELAVSQLSHFGDLLGRRITLEGPELRVTVSAAQSLGMALHELATNAVKHGALAHAEGRVILSWRMTEDEGAQRVALEWREISPVPVTPPVRRGFGTRVLTAMVEHATDGAVELRFEPQGLVWRVEAPAAVILET